ncbi:hypothetical protein [uncultured Microbacterium sp.]|uniref:hypothetical protein n=1 Tax=uncultured Microbacterium sp. TaxID=191216 RepID=UPI0025F1A064|nr:hypothetical protein [uncultured Microbacterium sp.]
MQRAIPVGEDAVAAADVALGMKDAQLLSDSSRAALSTARDQTEDAARTATRLVSRPLPELGRKPVWFWELYGVSSRLEKDLPVVKKTTQSVEASSAALRRATEAVDAAGTAAATAAGALAADLESTNRPAPNSAVLELRSVAESLAATSHFDGDTAQSLRTYETAVQTLRSGHAATLAAEAGPLQGARAEIEDFARGLAPGVLLDFEWADLVNDLGGANGYLSGETVWPVDDGKYSTIRLSNSVAEDWPGDSSKALVAHEVGHAITVKCRGMYDTTDSKTVEAWATAWAISMGFTDEGNGTQAYGAPPESLIAQAAGCR